VTAVTAGAGARQQNKINGRTLRKEVPMAVPVRAFVSPKFLNILFATDFSDCSEVALAYACTIARRYDSTLHLVHVVAPQPAKTASRQRAEAEMRKLLAGSPLKGIACHVRVENGPVSEVLSNLIQHEDVDLVALGTQGQHRLKVALGSTAAQIFQDAPCPVLTVARTADRERLRTTRLQRILYATDFSPGSFCALPYALSLAQGNQAHLLLLYVDRKESTCDWLEEARLEQRLADLLPASATQTCSIEPTIEIGPAAAKIVEVAAKSHASLIVMGARGATCGSSHLPGSTACAVVAQAACPVLTVRS
jgi:nucleotide-binding universal stress UspA family protein